MSNILGIELLICMNALNILQLKTSERLTKIYNFLRESIELMEQDRFFGEDISKASRLILSNLKMIWIYFILICLEVGLAPYFSGEASMEPTPTLEKIST